MASGLKWGKFHQSWFLLLGVNWWLLLSSGGVPGGVVDGELLVGDDL